MTAKELAIANVAKILSLVESPMYPMPPRIHRDYATRIVQNIIDAVVEEIDDRQISKGLS